MVYIHIMSNDTLHCLGNWEAHQYNKWLDYSVEYQGDTVFVLITCQRPGHHYGFEPELSRYVLRIKFNGYILLK